MTTTTIRAAVITGDAETNLDPRASRRLGAAVGLAIAAVPAVVALLAAQTMFLALGIPAALLSGACLAPWVRARGGIGGVAMSMAFLVILVAEGLLLGGALVQVVLEPASLGTTNVATAILGIGSIGLIGLVIVGVPMLVVTVPSAFAWAWIVRRLTS